MRQKKPMQERILDAEAAANRHLGDYNQAKDRGAEKAAQRSLEKAQKWLDKANDLRGLGSS